MIYHKFTRSLRCDVSYSCLIHVVTNQLDRMLEFSIHKASRSWMIVCLLLTIPLHSNIHASPAAWTFSPSKVGRALHEGGWVVEYSLGQINASPEFSFSLQLIYRNNREQIGLFSKLRGEQARQEKKAFKKAKHSLSIWIMNR